MNNKKQIAQKVIGDKKTISRGFHTKKSFKKTKWV